MSVNVGDKFKVKPEYKNQCGTLANYNFDYIQLESVYSSEQIGSYSAYTSNGYRVSGCGSCYQPYMLEPYSNGLTVEDVNKAVAAALKQHQSEVESARIQAEQYNRVLRDEYPFVGADTARGEDGSMYMMSDGRVGLIKKPIPKKSTFAQSLKKVAGHRNAKLRFGTKVA